MILILTLKNQTRSPHTKEISLKKMRSLKESLSFQKKKPDMAKTTFQMKCRRRSKVLKMMILKWL